MQLAQLQGDALAQIPRADARRLERLHGRQNAFHVRRGGLDLRQKTQAHLLEVVLQIAVVGDRVGDDPRDREVHGRQLGQFELFDELFLQGLAVLIAEIAAAIVFAGPRRIGWPAGLFPPRLVRDFHLGFFALIAGRGVAVEFGIFFLDRRVLALAHGIRRRIERKFVLRLEHDVGLERLTDVRLQIQ
jgi:hypothetical protein